MKMKCKHKFCTIIKDHRNYWPATELQNYRTTEIQNQRTTEIQN